MPTSESTINDALAEVLRKTRQAWAQDSAVRSENTGLISGSASRPDILVLEPNVSPVVIEAEVLPARTVEVEARERLGKQLSSNGRFIFSSIALRYPERLRDVAGSGLRSALTDAENMEFALFTGRDATHAERWPAAGWLTGTAFDLSLLVQSAALPPVLVDEAACHLVVGVEQAAGLLEELTTSHPAVTKRISEELKQEDVGQTRRMAMTILVNAFVFHENVARGPGGLADVRTLSELSGQKGNVDQSDLLEEWARILKVNYWPIFDIARRIMEIIPGSRSRAIIDRLADTARDLLGTGLMRSHDLMGVVFQQLIADRKFLAAFYTTPCGGSWGDPAHVKSLRIADFACGTGTLLSSAYQRIGQLHELAGGNTEALHAHMMSDALIGCDILPSAAHLTASMLSGAYPNVQYEDSSILTAGYGRLPDAGVALGSLELMDDQRRFPLYAITARVAHGSGEEEKELWEKLQHVSCDLILMNPPFTRATGHEAKKIGVPVPMFAGLHSDPEAQREMSSAVRRLFAGTSAKANAGEASYFLALADQKLKPDGTLGLVMPLSLLAGESWEESRKMIRGTYSEIVVVSLAGGSSSELSFSADTGMGECLVIGHRTQSKERRGTFVILRNRPRAPLEGATAARQIQSALNRKEIRRLEDGPYGGSPVTFGNDIIGHALDAPLPSNGPWNLARVWDLSLAQVAYQMIHEERIWLPATDQDDSVSLKMATVGEIGQVGPYHMDINANTASGGIRGPFKIVDWSGSDAPTYPVLWAHKAERERTMQFDADSEGTLRTGKNPSENMLVQKKAADVWATGSHCHFNRDFQFNSQSTAMQFTPRPTIGGRAWPSIKLPTPDHEKTLTAWGNTSLGILLHWWHANKQQAGRGSVGVTALEHLPVLDLPQLSAAQLAAAVAIFDDLKGEALMRIDQIDHDQVRHELDRRFLTEVLGVSPEICEPDGPLDLLRRKLAAEPSIHGGRGT